jgi:hypothetical protein
LLGIPSFEDVEDEERSLQESFENLISAWKFVIINGNLQNQQYESLMDLFSLVHTTALEYNFACFEQLMQLLQVQLLEKTILSFQE